MTQEPTFEMPVNQYPTTQLPVQPTVNPRPAGQRPVSQLPSNQPPPVQPTTRQINFGRLWAGGLATAVVTALIVVVGVLVARQLLGTPALSSSSSGRYAETSITSYALFAAAAALIGTLVMNLLLLAVPQPTRFFSWIAGLVTVAAVILPYTMAGQNGTKTATAVINLLVGIAISALVGSIAAGSIRRPDPRGGYIAPPVL